MNTPATQPQPTPKPPYDRKAALKGILFLLLIAVGAGWWAGERSLKEAKRGPMRYEVVSNEESLAVIRIKETIDRPIDTADLSAIADSLYAARQAVANPHAMYRVWFFYRPDWKGNDWYAAKFWQFNWQKQQLEPGELKVSGVTGNEKHDRAMYAQQEAPIRTSFDTTAYLSHVVVLNKDAIQRLLKQQIDTKGTVHAFVIRCRQQLDSANIVKVDATYDYTYHNFFIEVSGSATHTITGNGGYNFDIVESFRGAYDLFGHALYFHSSLCPAGKGHMD